MSTPATQVKASAPSNIPCAEVLIQAAKFAMEHDRPILMDYFMDTYTGKAFLGEEADSKEKILIKVSGDEYTSRISKVYRFDADVLVLTENSIYIVSGKITKRVLQKNQMPKDE
jgi:hypothetical protein